LETTYWRFHADGRFHAAWLGSPLSGVRLLAISLFARRIIKEWQIEELAVGIAIPLEYFNLLPHSYDLLFRRNYKGMQSKQTGKEAWYVFGLGFTLNIPTCSDLMII